MCPTAGAAVARSSRETSTEPNLRSAFDVLDADRDGKISSDDLRTFYGHYNFETTPFLSSSSSSSSSEEEIEIEGGDGLISSMISMADENRDGFVEYEEFEKVLLMGSNKESSISSNGNGRIDGYYYSLMENVFRVMDKDGDGRVGYEDLKSYLSSVGLIDNATDGDDDVKAMIRLAGDGDGGVTFEALLKVLFV